MISSMPDSLTPAFVQPISRQAFLPLWIAMNACTWLAAGIFLGMTMVLDPPQEMGILGAIAIGVVYVFSLVGAIGLNSYLFELRQRGRVRAFRVATIIPLLLGLAWNGFLLSIFLEEFSRR